jgi:endonuclease/exonuclease/phosphatase family metal-dependent hydrolase
LPIRRAEIVKLASIALSSIAPASIALGATAACGDEGVSGRVVAGAGGGGAAGEGGAGGGAQAVRLAVASWNARNLFNDVKDSPELSPETIDNDWPMRRGLVGSVLRSIDADVVVLQEVENRNVLDALDAEELGGRYPHRALVDANDPRGVDVAVLSKIVLLDVVTHKDDLFAKIGTTAPKHRYARDCLEVHLSHNGRRVVLLGVHFKAKEDDDPDKRLAEAQHTRAIADAVTTASPDTLVLVLGDFNDTPGSPPLAAVAGSTPAVYTDAADSIAAADRWTYKYFGKKELVDHMMASSALHAMLEPGSVAILRTPDAQAVSDHAPLTAVYAVR